ncbi:GNAT family N-acetyltransferase [Taibaiella koreensis]|uniref:GNAT family N-acetyltransferase n=1 Tax=Taibaiella koreensis TaxID=1268548 RepID=UPI000E59A9A0|nr:GNAT family N-acetyltransferase [Taibaiella koreensis]
MLTIDIPTIAEYPQLVLLWESSVRATHHFLKEEDILFYKEQLAAHYLHLVQLSCARDEHGAILGFSGVAEGNLEMLFVSAEARGKGVGKLLLAYATNKQGVTKVDVNEENEQAFGFYQHAGFTVTGRSEYDGQGKPYPILHMERLPAAE